MARKQLKTARGRKFDMEQFTAGKDQTLALGNLGGGKPVNAKGDILGQGGEIEIKREEVVRQYYREELPKTMQAPISDKNITTPADKTVFQTPEAAIEELEEASVKMDVAAVKTTRLNKKGS